MVVFTTEMQVESRINKSDALREDVNRLSGTGIVIAGFIIIIAATVFAAAAVLYLQKKKKEIRNETINQGGELQ